MREGASSIAFAGVLLSLLLVAVPMMVLAMHIKFIELGTDVGYCVQYVQC